MAQKIKTAAALGGLGGFNAHGVGFLVAAKDQGQEFDVITCTSGQIPVVADFLAGKDIKASLEEAIKRDNKFPAPFAWMNSLWIASTGDPGIFRPAFRENMLEWFKPMTDFSPKAFLDRMMPARVYISERSKESMVEMAEVLRASKTGVLFNAFYPQGGVEYVYANDAAIKALGLKYDQQDDNRIYKEIDADAVEAALWLYLYGFNAESELLDGAYQRQIILRELISMDRVFSVRPQNENWIGELPRNQLEVKDFTTELWFNASYAGETGRLDLINKLLADGDLTPGKYTHTDLIEIQVNHQYGFFEYFVEQQEVYDRAYVQTVEKLKELAGQASKKAA